MIDKIKYCLRLLGQQVAIVGTYGMVLLIMAGILYLQKQSMDLVFEVLRLSWIPLSFIMIYRMTREHVAVCRVARQQTVDSNDPLVLVLKQMLQDQVNRADLAEETALNHERRLVDYLLTWSHEMKLPLAALSLMTEQADEVDSDQVYKQVALLKNQLEMLLTYERLNDFNHDLDFGWTSIQPLVNDTIKEYSTFFIEKQVRPIIEVPTVQVLIDEKWLLFIIGQLVYNAIKYANPGTELTVRLTGRQLLIIDQGMPISASDLPRVFEPGFTGSNGRNQQAATGMGLYLVQQICQELNLEIALSSDNNKTQATLIFPKSSIQN